jgi:hypothetical protein
MLNTQQHNTIGSSLSTWFDDSSITVTRDPKTNQRVMDLTDVNIIATIKNRQCYMMEIGTKEFLSNFCIIPGAQANIEKICRLLKYTGSHKYRRTPWIAIEAFVLFLHRTHKHQVYSSSHPLFLPSFSHLFLHHSETSPFLGLSTRTTLSQLSRHRGS